MPDPALSPLAIVPICAPVRVPAATAPSALDRRLWRSVLRAAGWLGAAALLQLPGAAAAGRNELSFLEVAGVDASYALALADSGQVALHAGRHSYLYQGGSYSNVTTLLNSVAPQSLVINSSSIQVLNNRGDFLVTVNAGPKVRGFDYLYAGGRLQGIDSALSLYLLDDSGRLGGVARLDTGHRPVTWRNGELTELAGLSEYGDLALAALNSSQQAAGTGQASKSSVSHVLRWDGATPVDLGTLAGGYTEARAINNAGVVVGMGESAKGNGSPFNTSAFVSVGNRLTALPGLGGGWASANGINDSSQIIGLARHADGRFVPVLWNRGEVFDLQQRLAPAGWTLNEVVDINRWGQILFNASIVDDQGNGRSSALLLTPQPDWTGGSGRWDDAERWDYGGFGAFGFAPGLPHAVRVHASGQVLGPAGATRLASLSLQGSGGQLSFQLQGAQLLADAGIQVGAAAVLGGSGQLGSRDGGLEVAAGGTLRLSGGQQLQLDGRAHSNAGTAQVSSLSPLAPAQWWVGSGQLLNLGGAQLRLQNAEAGFADGLVNQGLVTASGAVSVDGAIRNEAGAQVLVSGGAEAVFHGTIRNDGEWRVGSGSRATFYGQVSGAGDWTGGGAKLFEGGFHAGNSPAAISVDGAVEYGAGSLLSLDLAGTTPGDCSSCHGQIRFGGEVSFAGGTLRVSLYNGFVPQAGQWFGLFVFEGGAPQGGFATLQLPALGSGLSWKLDGLYSTGQIGVVPEPAAALLWLAGLAAGAVRLRGRQRS